MVRETLLFTRKLSLKAEKFHLVFKFVAELTTYNDKIYIFLMLSLITLLKNVHI